MILLPKNNLDNLFSTFLYLEQEGKGKAVTDATISNFTAYVRHPSVRITFVRSAHDQSGQRKLPHPSAMNHGPYLKIMFVYTQCFCQSDTGEAGFAFTLEAFHSAGIDRKPVYNPKILDNISHPLGKRRLPCRKEYRANQSGLMKCHRKQHRS
ncbi:hypothetical protein RRG08_034258 [Elysia crispata]|uniref:Uncharacterized protein n=1 Tax=Elysia crispata TaxID=231223 RepID=A0AAE1A0I7_9GAST|nr:hypothetical protein RRG08_034258 [Elysia crispata]